MRGQGWRERADLLLLCLENASEGLHDGGGGGRGDGVTRSTKPST